MKKAFYAIYGKRTIYGVTDKGRNELFSLIDEISKLINIIGSNSVADHDGKDNESIN